MMMKNTYTQEEVDAIRKDFEGNPFFRITSINIENRSFTTVRTVNEQQYTPVKQNKGFQPEDLLLIPIAACFIGMVWCGLRIAGAI